MKNKKIQAIKRDALLVYDLTTFVICPWKKMQF